MAKAKTVSAYIAAAPPKARIMLKQLRRAIRSFAPGAEEKISYGIPYYGYFGRLIYFAAFRNHIGVYIMSGSRKALPVSLLPFRKTSATLQFPLGTKVPISAIQKIVRAQVAHNKLGLGRR